MKTNAATLKIGADTTGLSDGLRRVKGSLGKLDAASKTTSKSFGASFGKMAAAGTVLAGAFVAARAAYQAFSYGLKSGFEATKNSIANANDLNETISKVGVIFDDAADSINQWASGAAESLGMSKKEAMDAAATFATFGKSAGGAGEELSTFAQEMVGVSADLASFYNTSPEEAITAIGAALRGESEPIRRYGVLLDDATLRNQAFKMGLISSTKEALTPQTKVLAAQAEILRQTTDAQGDFARTSDGLANQQRIMSAGLKDVSAQMGQALLPIVNAVAKAFNEHALPALKHFTTMLSGFDTGSWGEKMVATLLRVADVMIGIFKNPLDSIKLIGVALSLAARSFGNILINGFITFGRTIKEFFSGTLPMTILDMVKNALILAYTRSMSFLLGKMGDLIAWFPEAFGKAITAVGKFLSDVFSKIVNFFAKDFKNAMESPIDFIRGKLKSELKTAGKSGAFEFTQAYNEANGNVLQKMSAGLDATADLYGEKLKGNVGELQEGFKQLVANVEPSTKDFFGAEGAMGRLKDGMSNLEEKGKKWREGIKQASDETKENLKQGEKSTAKIKGQMQIAAENAKKIKKELKLSEQIALDIAKAIKMDAVDKGGRLEGQARKAIELGNFRKAERLNEKIRQAENETVVRGIGEKRDRRAVRDIAKAEGLDIFGKSNKELMAELLKKRQEELKIGQQGKDKKQMEDAKKPGPIKKPEESIMESVKNILKLVEKIEPKLPQQALGL